MLQTKKKSGEENDEEERKKKASRYEMLMLPMAALVSMGTSHIR